MKIIPPLLWIIERLVRPGMRGRWREEWRAEVDQTAARRASRVDPMTVLRQE